MSEFFPVCNRSRQNPLNSAAPETQSFAYNARSELISVVSDVDSNYKINTENTENAEEANNSANSVFSVF